MQPVAYSCHPARSLPKGSNLDFRFDNGATIVALQRQPNRTSGNKAPAGPGEALISFQEVVHSTCTYKDTYSCGSLNIASAVE